MLDEQSQRLKVAGPRQVHTWDSPRPGDVLREHLALAVNRVVLIALLLSHCVRVADDPEHVPRPLWQLLDAPAVQVDQHVGIQHVPDNRLALRFQRLAE